MLQWGGLHTLGAGWGSGPAPGLRRVGGHLAGCVFGKKGSEDGREAVNPLEVPIYLEIKCGGTVGRRLDWVSGMSVLGPVRA